MNGKGCGCTEMDGTKKITAMPTLTKKGCAALAAMKTGAFRLPIDGDNGFDEESFNKFWMQYLTILVEKQQKDMDYFLEVFNKQSEERANQAREQRRQNLKFAILFSLSFLFGSLVAIFFSL